MSLQALMADVKATTASVETLTSTFVGLREETENTRASYRELASEAAAMSDRLSGLTRAAQAFSGTFASESFRNEGAFEFNRNTGHYNTDPYPVSHSGNVDVAREQDPFTQFRREREAAFDRSLASTANGGWISSAYAQQLVEWFAEAQQLLRTGRDSAGDRATPQQIADAIAGKQFWTSQYETIFPQLKREFGSIDELAKDLLELRNRGGSIDGRGGVQPPRFGSDSGGDREDDGSDLLVERVSAVQAAIAQLDRRLPTPAPPVKPATEISDGVDDARRAAAAASDAAKLLSITLKSADEQAKQAEHISTKLQDARGDVRDVLERLLELNSEIVKVKEQKGDLELLRRKLDAMEKELSPILKWLAEQMRRRADQARRRGQTASETDQDPFGGAPPPGGGV